MMARIRALWKTFGRSRQREGEMAEEMRFHIESEAERLRRQGLDPEEARRQAHVRFGGIEKYKEAGRDERGRQWLDALSLDARLGVRMLVKSWGLTLVAGSAIAVAIAIGAGFFELLGDVLEPVVPLPQGDRIVSLQYATDPGNTERRIARDFAQWRDGLTSIEHIGAFRRISLNLTAGDGLPTVIPVTEISASGFDLAQVPPLLGRYLLASDEQQGAQRVLLLGYDAWHSKFGADPGIVGRVVKLGAEAHTIVGVMPIGFRFPVNNQCWVPLRFDPARFPPLQGPPIFVFGRLAPGASMQQAQAELETARHSSAARYPKEYERLRPYVLPYTREHSGTDDPVLLWMFQLARLLVSGLVVIVAANVAILMYARTTTRNVEMSLRSALGASRRRILMQLFTEALALSSVGAAVGLALSQVGLWKLQSQLQTSGSTPFWLTFSLSTPTVIYAFALAAMAAVIFGVVPGLRVTGAPLQNVLRELGGATKVRLGGTWTFLVVAQVALAVAALPLSLYVLWQVARSEVVAAGFPVEQFVTAEIALGEDSLGPKGTEQDGRVWMAHLGARQRELMARLQAEPGVSGVTFSSHIPGDVEMFLKMEFAGSAARAEGSTGAVMRVAPDMFSVYDAKLIAGRAFTAGDRSSTTNGVVVNRRFVEEFMRGSGVLGQQFRYPNGEGYGLPQWYEVIGVVDDFPAFRLEPGVEAQATVYHPAAPGDIGWVVMSVRLRGASPDGFVPKFRQIAAQVDPTLQLHEVMPLTAAYDERRAALRLLALAVGVVTLSVLLLSAAGIYALMSFTVARRTREIGIRAALGAHPRRLLWNVFGRVLWQIAAGVLLGSIVSAGLLSASTITTSEAVSLIIAVAVIMTAVGVMAASGPAMRSLRIHPSEALRAEA
jgi:putative ABC transport system permease protein